MDERHVSGRVGACTHTDANGRKDVLQTLFDLGHALVCRRMAVAVLPFQLVTVDLCSAVMVRIIGRNGSVLGDGVRRDRLQRLGQKRGGFAGRHGMRVS